MKKVIIIGATSGIGRELARQYISAGCLVGITGRRNALLQSLQKEFNEAGEAGEKNIFTECFDVTGKENIVHVNSLVNQLNGLDLLIYNSGYGDPSPSLDWTIEKNTVDVNVNGFLEITNWAFNYFVQQGHGHIAAISSVASNRGNSFAPAYSASKAFVSCYLEGLYIKAKRMKIPVFVTDVQPGFVKTKEINLKGLFWVVPLNKAVRQMVSGIESREFRVYVSRRWWLVAKLMKIVPRFIYRRIG
jgi:short-subunit dehydrogenase